MGLSIAWLIWPPPLEYQMSKHSLNFTNPKIIPKKIPLLSAALLNRLYV